jgi:hypothetical protein
MDGQEHRRIEALIAKALPGQMPNEVSEKLHAQLTEFRAQLAAGSPQSRIAHRRKQAAWWGFGITAVASIAAAALFVLFLRAQHSFAQVAATTLKQPWIHVQMAYSDEANGKGAGEAWYSPAMAISAQRSHDSIEYHDHRLEVFYTYDLKEQLLYRVPDDGRAQSTHYEGMIESLAVLVKEGRVLEKPLDKLDFLGPEREQMKVIDQEMANVTEGDRRWVDYRMTVSGVQWAQPARMLFRVDADTKLPRLCRIEGQRVGGKPMTSEQQFDYPENGPADIYDLGVPQTAQLVDRVPAGDLKRILATIRAGRERMDDYRAVFVMHMEGMDYAWWLDFPSIWYRKGDKFRADSVCGWTGDLSAIKRPEAGEDLGAWWRERVKFFQFYPQTVMCGSTTYRCETKNVKDPDGSEHREIAAVNRYEQNSLPGEAIPVEWSMLPEFACRPPLGIGGPHFQPVLNLKPEGGPDGCILLTVRHTSDEGRINKKGIGLPDENRFWLDPQRDYIVMRFDWLTRNEAGEEQVFECDTVEEAAKSPRGVWYATKIRRSFPSQRDANGNFADQIYQLYVDFDVDLPDALFDPPVTGRIR